MLSLDPVSLNSCARFQWAPCTSHPLPSLPFLTKPRGPLFPELISFKRKKICRVHFGDCSSLAKACAALSPGRVCGLSGEAGGSLLPTPPHRLTQISWLFKHVDKNLRQMPAPSLRTSYTHVWPEGHNPGYRNNPQQLPTLIHIADRGPRGPVAVPLCPFLVAFAEIVLSDSGLWWVLTLTANTVESQDRELERGKVPGSTAQAVSWAYLAGWVLTSWGAGVGREGTVHSRHWFLSLIHLPICLSCVHFKQQFPWGQSLCCHGSHGVSLVSKG